MKLAIVILNWNGKELLEKFLPFVIKHSQEASIYLADNASNDDSVEFVQKNYPEVKIIQNNENCGYAKGYNEVLKQIDADVYCLLNSDVEVTANWLQPIIEAFNKHKNTAIIQPKILDYNKRDYFEYAGAAGGFIDKYGYPYCRGRIFNTIEKDAGQYDDVQDIFWASGACLFIRSHIYKELNGLDELYFAHMEEIDLCWRAKNIGYNVKYIGDSLVYHVGGATLNAANANKTYLNFRNSLFTLTKNSKGNLMILLFVRLLLDGIAAIKFLFEMQLKHSYAVIKAHFSFYYHLNGLLQQRKTIKNKIKYYEKTSIVLDYFVYNKTVYHRL
ncbi:MAG: glycosyltransferase family 2 protein [Flaviramulus sp.]|nr:glycosyltransferase family 2 protein [Flaviramulus sp.]NNC50603.1 glycosyltransferase family 2 protein [Flaviramulus sp.]